MMKKLPIKFALRIYCLFIATALWSQASTSSVSLTSTFYSNFACDVYLEIYNGLYDWYGGNDYSGGNAPVSSGDKTAKGAVTVANKNDTDGDGIIDLLDMDVRSGSSTLGRNEIDLIKVKIRKGDIPLIPTANVVFKIKSGNVKVWTEPWKGVEITSLPYIFPAAQLDKTLYLEALDASDYQGIVIEVEYNGTIDSAVATAVWATRSRYWRENTFEPIPGPDRDLTTLDDLNISRRINNFYRSTDGTRYGHGDFNRGKIPGDDGTNDKRFGGRILFEFQVSPIQAARLVNFDITRQRKSRTATNFYGKLDGFHPNDITDFPNDPSQNKDNELPNDDTNSDDEDNSVNLGFIYSFDVPSTFKKSALVYKPNGLISDSVAAFKVSRNSFREFVRVQVKPTPFARTGPNIVLGSRASDHTEWHCSYYTRRFDSNTMLSVDSSLVSASIPLKFKNSYTGNGTVKITVANDAVSDNFYLAYTGIDDSWFLSDSIGNGAYSGGPSPDGTWTVTLNGVTAVVKRGTINFQNDFTWTFNTFKTALPSKSNEINLMPIDPATGF